MPSVLPATPSEPFDFRSGQFAADASALARATNQPLVRCRQQLFIAEGDMALAYELLIAGFDEVPTPRTLH